MPICAAVLNVPVGLKKREDDGGAAVLSRSLVSVSLPYGSAFSGRHADCSLSGW